MAAAAKSVQARKARCWRSAASRRTHRNQTSPTAPASSASSARAGSGWWVKGNSSPYCRVSVVRQKVPPNQPAGANSLKSSSTTKASARRLPQRLSGTIAGGCKRMPMPSSASSPICGSRSTAPKRSGPATTMIAKIPSATVSREKRGASFDSAGRVRFSPRRLMRATSASPWRRPGGSTRRCAATRLRCLCAGGHGASTACSRCISPGWHTPHPTPRSPRSPPAAR